MRLRLLRPSLYLRLCLRLRLRLRLHLTASLSPGCAYA
jgi:hypothetical protein